ncbi:MAG: TIGR03663 family protein [Candidatus Aureabacteria bacterium]|nr:TIGR03663 family protein [Candidatus Auribacterota bacterium]
MNQNIDPTASAAPEKEYLVIRFDWYKAIYLAIIVFTIFTRVYGLQLKPYHHDESLYATYSWYLYDGKGYKYDPMMHGPFMFYLDAMLFSLFGAGDFVARSSSAVFGIALVCCTLLLRRRLGKIGSLTAAALFAISPTFMYFSRFFREDIFVAFWAFLAFALFVNYLDTRKRGFLYGAAAAFAFVFCVKENSYIFLAIFVSFPVFMRIFERFFVKREPTEGEAEGEAEGNAESEGEGKAEGEAVVQLPAAKIPLLDILISLAIFFGVFYLFFTSFFQNPGGFVDGLYRKSLGYWVHQDKIQRIKDVFTYFCPLAIVYELPLLVILFAGLVALLKTSRLSRNILLVSSVIGIPLMLFWHQTLPADPWDTKFHMTNTLHIVFAVYIFVIMFTAVCHYLEEGRRFPAFLAYWSMSSALIYSYAGEKVPWLLMHILMPLVLWVSLFMDEFLRSERFRRHANAYVVLCMIGILLYLQASLRLCFINEANPVERMVYTQTSVDIKECLKEIAEYAAQTGKGENFAIGVQGESSWPFTWYLRDYKNWFHPGSITNTQKAVVAVDWEKRKDYGNILEPNYIEKRRKLRVWWIPDPASTLKNPVAAWLKYYFFRETWNPTKRKGWWSENPDPAGSQDIAFYVRKDLVGEKMGAVQEIKEGEGTPKLKPIVPEKYEIIGQVKPALIFGERGSAPGRFDEPRGICADGEGSIYVADTKNHRWQKFDKEGKPLLSVGAQGKGEAQFEQPTGIAVDQEGNVYVSDTWNHRIQKFDATGKFVFQWGGPEVFWAPKGLAFDSAGNLYVADTGRHRIQKFSREGKSLLLWGSEEQRVGEKPGEFGEPVGVAIDPNGIIAPADKEKKQKEVRGEVVYVTDTANKRVQKFDLNGKFLGMFGVLGWEEFYTEPFVAVDAKSRVWVTDSRNNRIQIFDSSGTLLGLWSGKGFKPGDFNIPIGIAIRGGRVYIADTQNHRVQAFDEKSVYKK